MKNIIKIAEIKIISWMCDNTYTLQVFKDDNFIDYHLYGGHARSGIPNALTNLDSEGKLPDEVLDGEVDEQIVERVRVTLLNERLCKSVAKVIIRKTP
jgi:hypothetical protein